MAPLDVVSLSILFGAVLVLAGILSSLVALRFGAPLLLVFLVVGMLAGESGPGGVVFNDVRTTYLVGSDRACADSVRRRPAHAILDFPQRAGAVRDAGDRRRPADGGITAPVARAVTRSGLDRVAARRRRRRFDRCGSGVLARPCARAAAAAACRCDARDRVRHQRPVRDLSHHRAGRNAAHGGKSSSGVADDLAEQALGGGTSACSAAARPWSCSIA